MVLLVRPQEVVAAVQALAQAYLDYYGAVADANRAQFRLYRALGQPAQCLLQDQANAEAVARLPCRPRRRPARRTRLFLPPARSRAMRGQGSEGVPPR